MLEHKRCPKDYIIVQKVNDIEISILLYSLIFHSRAAAEVDLCPRTLHGKMHRQRFLELEDSDTNLVSQLRRHEVRQ